jgi:hypothetical protein
VPLYDTKACGLGNMGQKYTNNYFKMKMAGEGKIYLLFWQIKRRFYGTDICHKQPA